jgi:hypothetical protein
VLDKVKAVLLHCIWTVLDKSASLLDASHSINQMLSGREKSNIESCLAHNI